MRNTDDRVRAKIVASVKRAISDCDGIVRCRERYVLDPGRCVSAIAGTAHQYLGGWGVDVIDPTVDAEVRRQLDGGMP